MKRATIRLSKLRDIGWAKWDPIGLLERGDTWEHKPFAGEYDAYLIDAAGKLRRGTSEEKVIRYLVDIERDYMGLGMQRDTIRRATDVVEAIQASDQIWNETTSRPKGAILHSVGIDSEGSDDTPPSKD